jgi:orotate phosphoribosyltransferase
MNRPRYPLVQCVDHPGDPLPGYLICDHLRRDAKLEHVFIPATNKDIGTAVCMACDAALVQRKEDKSIPEPPLHLACVHFVTEHLDPPALKVPAPPVERNDTAFLSYVELHATTDMHLFSVADVQRLHELAGESIPPAAQGRSKFLGMDSSYVGPRLAKARARLDPTSEPAFYRAETRERLFTLLRKVSVRTGKTFTLTSGRTSDFFVDCKPAVLSADGHQTAGRVLLHLLEETFPMVEAVAGVELGGCPLASAVSTLSAVRHLADWPHAYGLNALYIRKARKDHGTEGRIEGMADPGAQVVLLEDVLTSGGSALSAVRVLQEFEFNVLGVLALVDREEGAADTFAAAGIKYRAVFTQTELRA